MNDTPSNQKNQLSTLLTYDDLTKHNYTVGGKTMRVHRYGREVMLTRREIASLLGLEEQAVRRALTRGIEKGAISKGYNLYTPVKRGSATDNRLVNWYKMEAVLFVAYRANNQDINEKLMAFRAWVESTLNREIASLLRLDQKEKLSTVQNYIALSPDYDSKSPYARHYFGAFTNRLLFAISGQFASELKVRRADGQADTMGMTVWDGERVTLNAAQVATNYLTQKELRDFNTLLDMLLSAITLFDSRGEVFTMREWSAFLDEQVVLTRMRRINRTEDFNRKQAERHVRQQYTVYKQVLACELQPMLPGFNLDGNA